MRVYITISNDNNNKNILLVDDDKDILYTLFDIYLKSMGYTIVSFFNPVEALNNFNNNFTNQIFVIADY